MTFHCVANRTRTIQDARVTAAVWGPFDQYFITGDDGGALTKYDIVNVRSSKFGQLSSKWCSLPNEGLSR